MMRIQISLPAIRKVPFVGMTGWAVNSITDVIEGSIPFLPIITLISSMVEQNTSNICIKVQVFYGSYTYEI